MTKSTPEEIRARFDADVERFSNLETGQTATMDALLSLELVARAAAAVNPNASTLLDIGCGAGNYTLKLMEGLPLRAVTLVDLSAPMLERATARIAAAGEVRVTAIQGDVRDIPLPPDAFDVATAAATLHHLREEAEWEAVLRKVRDSLHPGGSFWISDLLAHELEGVQALMWDRYGEYLAGLKGADYRDHVFAYIEREDTPRPLTWQLEKMREAGFRTVEVLHKHACFGAFGGVR